MSYNIQSNNIKVFPSVQRTQVESKKFTESRIVGLVNELVDQSGFVINPTDDPILSGKFEFDIHGYYFSLSNIEVVISQFADANQIWASIELENIAGNDDVDYDVLKGTDVDGVYDGVIFSSTQPSSINSLLILERDASGAWLIPEESKLGTGCSIIDGGDVVDGL